MKLNKHSQNILLVDDDEMTRLLLRESIGSLGDYEIHEAPNGSQALELYHRNRYCMLLLDVRLPDMSGFDICKYVRASEQGREVPIVMITGLDDSESIEQAYDYGATDFIAKPLNWSLISYRLRYVLRASDDFKALKQSESRLEQAQEIAKLGYWELNCETDEVRFSFQLSKMLSLPGTGFEHGLDELTHLIHESDRALFSATVSNVLEKNGAEGFDIEARLQLSDESVIYTHIQAQLVTDESCLLIGTIQDISSLKESQFRLNHIAHHDALTDLPNRVLFHRLLEGAIDRSQRSNQKVALLYIDLDRFKYINDSLGHDIGDMLLIRVAERLRSVIRLYDTVARLGGDEFAVILDSIDSIQSVSQLTQRILEGFEFPFEVDGQRLHVEASIGISLYPDNGITQEELLRNADTAMYDAKRRTQSKLAFYSSELTEETMKSWTLENELREGLKNNEFHLVYQPKVDPESGILKGVEALIRWDRGEQGIISPADFIPVAEDTGLIVPMGKWVIESAVQQLKAWKDTEYNEISIAVNVSASQLHDERLCQFIENELKKSDVPSRMLEIELTEEYLIEANIEGSHCLETLKSINDLGIKMAIDDFGTGYSSFSQLKNLPISTLKIDKTFVDYVPDNSKDVAIVRSIVSFAKNLGLNVVAEGVETNEQLDCIHNYGCDLIQGYVYSKPVAARDIERMIQDKVLKINRSD
ncbi:EAL domain-containing protein [Vibrio sp. JC009]|uniref:putative bifunctional diguanylate cyclase/phosphodiesterase n=1 Tax=Vibrio sp. JC009 TaxID=2912314 RepID=UPI0023B1A09F|nr:EAL domain-containing protein [Vibrio sp. JC009]WED24704.1 EAL domain-containing protein [Vibrio sp. JC009]